MKSAMRVALGTLLSLSMAVGSSAATEASLKQQISALSLSKAQKSEIHQLYIAFTDMANEGMTTAEFGKAFAEKVAPSYPTDALKSVHALLIAPVERAQTIARVQIALKNTLRQSSMSDVATGAFFDAFEGTAMKAAMVGDAKVAQSLFAEIAAPLRAAGLSRAHDDVLASLFAERVAAE